MSKLPPHLPPKTCSVPFHRYISTIKVALLSVIIGVVAGGAAALAVIAWIPSIFPSVETTALLRTNLITTQIAEGNLKIAPELWTKVRSASVLFYPKSTQTTNFLNTQQTDLQNQQKLEAYKVESYIGIGMFVTSDGWIITPTSAIPNPNNVIVIGNGKKLTITKWTKDDLSGLTFIKVDGNSYPIIPLAGASKWINEYWWTGMQSPNLVKEREWLPENKIPAEKIYNSDQITMWPYIKNESVYKVGQPIISSTGELIALLGNTSKEKTKILPMPLAVPVLNKIFLGEELERPKTNINYRSIQDWKFVNVGATINNLHYGAIIHNLASQEDNNKLKIDDIILSVEDITLENNRDLGMLLYTYIDRENVRIKLIRDGQEMTTNIR